MTRISEIVDSSTKLKEKAHFLIVPIRDPEKYVVGHSHPAQSVRMAVPEQAQLSNCFDTIKVKGAHERNRRRKGSNLADLCVLVNSRVFREQDGADSQDIELVMDMVTEMVSDRVACSMKDLSFVKSLGEGSFAYVDLYHFKDGRPQVAVKRMRDKCALRL